MTKLTKLFLLISVVAFGVSLTGPGSEILWGMAKPTGAVFFVLFMIFRFLGQETALYDDQCRAGESGAGKKAAHSTEARSDRGLPSGKTVSA